AELIALVPDVIVTTGDSNTGPLLQATRTVPIVFVLVPDPVGAGFVASLARPGGNATGFLNFEFGMSGKWPELLKQVAPSVIRVAVLRDPGASGSMGQLGAIQGVVSSLRMEASPIDLRDVGEIARAIVDFARSPNGGLVVLPSGLSSVHRELIIELASRHRLPAVYPFRYFVEDGGLICYGPDAIDQLRRAAGYVDRILKGEKPADLPVQAPTKYELVINLKTAKALGLDLPASVLARADEVIDRAARIHHDAWGRGGVAGGGSCAAGRAEQTRCCVHRLSPRRPGKPEPHCGVPAGDATPRLDRRTEPAHHVSLG